MVDQNPVSQNLPMKSSVRKILLFPVLPWEVQYPGCQKTYRQSRGGQSQV